MKTKFAPSFALATIATLFGGCDASPDVAPEPEQDLNYKEILQDSANGFIGVDPKRGQQAVFTLGRENDRFVRVPCSTVLTEGQKTSVVDAYLGHWPLVEAQKGCKEAVGKTAVALSVLERSGRTSSLGQLDNAVFFGVDERNLVAVFGDVSDPSWTQFHAIPCSELMEFNLNELVAKGEDLLPAGVPVEPVADARIACQVQLEGLLLK